MTETREQIEARHAREIAEWEAKWADPLLEEAETLHQDWIAQKHEDAIAMLIAALRRGMELAAAPLMPVQQSACTADAWPGEAELREMVFDAWTDSADWTADRFIARLHARMAGKATEPEWIEWHGGECPVPAGTRVEYRLRCYELPFRVSVPESLRWGHSTPDASLWRDDIIAYRILGADQ